MRLSQGCTPVPSTYRQHAQLRDDDGGADGGRDFFGGLDPEADVPFGVANDDDSLEASALTSAGLLLYGLDLFHQHQRQHTASLSQSSPQCSIDLPSTHKIHSGSSKNLFSYLHNLILQLRQKPIHNLILLDRQAVQVYLLHALDLPCLHKTPQFRHWLPFFLFAPAGAAAGSSTAAPTTSASVSAAGAEAAAGGAGDGLSFGCVGHCRFGRCESGVER
jgi:hypothetical protein